jgi:hypothetical protein
VTVPASGCGTQVVRSRFDALGTDVELVTAGRPTALGTATRLPHEQLAALDAADSWLRADLGRQVRLLHRAGSTHRLAGRPVQHGPQRTDTVDGADFATLGDPLRTVRVDRPYRPTRTRTAADIPAMLGSPQGTVTVDGPEATVGGVR